MFFHTCVRVYTCIVFTGYINSYKLFAKFSSVVFIVIIITKGFKFVKCLYLLSKDVHNKAILSS